MSVTPPQPGVVLRAELVLTLAALRANLALLEHILDQRQDDVLAAAAVDVRSAIARIASHSTSPT